VHFPVGILSPSWLRGAQYLGSEAVDGAFQCHVWTKADFIVYYENIKVRRQDAQPLDPIQKKTNNKK